MDNEKFNYFMERTEKDLETIIKRLDTLWDYRLLQLGGSIVISMLGSGLVVALYLYFGVR